MMSSIFLMSHELSQPIRTGSERKSSEADDPATEGPHSVGVWTLKIMEFVKYYIYLNIFKERGSNKLTFL